MSLAGKKFLYFSGVWVPAGMGKVGGTSAVSPVNVACAADVV